MRETPQVFEIETRRKFECLIHLPENYEEEDRSYPLLIFFHGGGERGDSIQEISQQFPKKKGRPIGQPCIQSDSVKSRLLYD